jgi:hypothetical protein
MKQETDCGFVTQLIYSLWVWSVCHIGHSLYIYIYIYRSGVSYLYMKLPVAKIKYRELQLLQNAILDYF